MRDYIKPSTARKPDMIVLHTGTSDLKNKTPSDIASEIAQLAKSIPRGDKLSEKAKKVNIHLQEKCTTDNFAIIQHTNINSKLDLFPDKSHPNKKWLGILKGNFRRFINDCKL